MDTFCETMAPEKLFTQVVVVWVRYGTCARSFHSLLSRHQLRCGGDDDACVGDVDARTTLGQLTFSLRATPGARGEGEEEREKGSIEGARILHHDLS